jgi:hypothetical protein
MNWTLLGRVLEIALLGWFFALAVAVVWLASTGRTTLRGLLADRQGEARAFHLHRVQLIGSSLIFGVGYALSALHGPVSQSIPDVPTVLLGGLLGSHGAFLGGKLINRQQ